MNFNWWKFSKEIKRILLNYSRLFKFVSNRRFCKVLHVCKFKRLKGWWRNVGEMKIIAWNKNGATCNVDVRGIRFNGSIHYPALYLICVPFIIYPHDLVIRSRHYACTPPSSVAASLRGEGTSIGSWMGSWKVWMVGNWSAKGVLAYSLPSPKRAP